MTSEVGATPEYVVVGHCALDVQPDGSFLPGGTVLYGALTAARMGMRAAMLTAGDPAALTPALAPFRDAFAIHILPTPTTTIFENTPTPQGRKQTLHGWAGAILPDALPAAWRNAAILHLGPIANELPPDAWAEALGTTDARLTLATPQGWLRRWGTLPSPVRHEPLALPDALLDRLGAMVISVEERDVAEAAVRRVAIGGLGAITDGPDGVDILRGGTTAHVPTFAVTVRDETGAGDVFAAAWAVQIARGESPEAAARVACAAASLSITAPGPRGIPTGAEIAALLATNSDRAER
ncbi:MAG TPA: PfkB family carbohydrate kinase [Thermomicrobiales bacterium]